MKILLVGTYPPDQQHSLTGFAKALSEGLRSSGIETRLIAPRKRLIRLAERGRYASSLAKWLGHADKLLLFPFELRRAAAGADVVHLVDHGLAPYTKYLRDVPHIVTCNDLIAMRAVLGDLPEWSIGGTAVYFQKMIRKGLLQSQHVVCISQATRADLCRLTHIPLERTSVIYDSLFHPYQPMPELQRQPILQRLGVENGPYFFHIGRNVPTKNRIGVLKIFAEARQAVQNLQLVMAGEPLAQELRDYAREHKIDTVLHEKTGLSNDELCALYSGAWATLFPSYYEGFGLPIIEAQACGCPVFTSDRAPMTEVGGEAAGYFDPQQPEAAARMIVTQLQRAGERQRMIEAGFDNLKRFAPERMAKEYLKIYTSVMP